MLSFSLGSARRQAKCQAFMCECDDPKLRALLGDLNVLL